MNETGKERGSPDDAGWTSHFEALQTPPPEDLVERVMSSLPERPGRARHRLARRWWPDSGAWLAPALAGAAVAVVVMGAVMLRWPTAPAAVAQTGVTFVVHAPAAEQVELVGSFNDWQSGRIELIGPDATGRWSVTVPLPEGRHEYMFLVDGRRWIADPHAAFFRDDGFGNLNGVIDVTSEAS